MYLVINSETRENLTSKTFPDLASAEAYSSTVHPENLPTLLEIDHDHAAILVACGVEVTEENLETIDSAEVGNDFSVELDGMEFRLISDDSIERIHADEIQEYVDDCILNDCPETLQRYFDYDSFIRDCRIGDGYGHHFSSYDGSEVNAASYYIFRIR